MSKRIVRHVFYLMGFFCTLIGASCSNRNAGSSYRIVVIQSFEAEYRGYEKIEDKIQEAFKKQHINAELQSFYLDCESYLPNQETKRIYDNLNTLTNWKPNLILVYDDQATFSLLNSGHPLTKEIPIIFAGVNYPNWPLLKKYSDNVTGFWDKPEYLKTAGMIEQLFGPMQINVWLDKTYLGRQCTHRLLDELKEANINQLGEDTFSLGENGAFYFGNDSAQLPRKTNIQSEKPLVTTYSYVNSRESSIGYHLWARSSLAQYSIFVQSKRDLSSQRLGLFANNATFTVVNEGFGIGEGLMGGYITSLKMQIKQSVEVASKILKGENIQEIPITEASKGYLVDWVELQRWRVPLNTVLKHYHIINMPFSERYRLFILLSSAFLSLAIILIIAYLIFLYQRENRNKQQAQEKLKQGERFLSLALAGGKVFAFQLKDSLFYFDTDFYVFAGVKDENITIDKFRNCLHRDDITMFNQHIEQAYNGSLPENVSQIRCYFDGAGYQWWEYRYTYDQEERTFNGLCLNIQKMKEAELELIEARKKAEESDKMKSAFLANMSHEIRTPLNAIVGFSNIIGGDDIELAPEEKSEFLKLINTNCDLLLKLINDILDLSRIESGRMDFAFATYNLTELFNDIYHTHQLLMPAGVNLQIQLPNTPLLIETDHHRLRQVITNFINNAAKFTTKGYIKIGYSNANDPDTVTLYVEDTGIGIPKEKQKAVFERFNKLDEFAQGTGLGLAICQVIISRFGGSIHLESEEGKGSRFTIKLPLLNPDCKKT